MGFDCSYFANATDVEASVVDHIKALGVFGTAVGVFGGISTMWLIILFILTMFHSVKRSPPKWRRLITWIVSMPVIVSVLSLVTFIVPGAAILCDTVKQSYLPFLLMHFIDLSMVMEGGHSGTVRDLSNKQIPINFCRPPWCCVGFCFKKVPYGRKNLHIMKSLVYQTPLAQLLINLLITVLETAGALERLVLNTTFACLGVLSILFFTMGMYGYNVLTTGFAEISPWKNYALKARVLFICVVIFKGQTLILLLLGVGGSIPCVQPYVSPVVMRKTIDASLCLVESLIFGVVFYPVFRVNRKDIIQRQNVDAASSRGSSISVIADEVF